MKFQIIITILCVFASLAIGFYQFYEAQDQELEYVSAPPPPQFEAYAERLIIPDTLTFQEPCDCDNRVDTIYVDKIVEKYILGEDFFDNMYKIISVITPLLVPVVTYKINKKEEEQ